MSAALDTAAVCEIAAEFGALSHCSWVAHDGDTCVELWSGGRRLHVWLGGDDAEVLCGHRAISTSIVGAPTTKKNVRKAVAWLVSGDSAHILGWS